MASTYIGYQGLAQLMEGKMKKHKKRLFRKLSLCMAISVMLTSFLFPELFVRALDNAFSAQIIEMPEIMANTDKFNYKLTMNSTELTPEISAMNMSFGWSGKSSKDNVTYYMYTATVNDPVTDKTYSFTEDNAIMFYVKMPFDSPDNQLYFQFNTSTLGDEEKNGKRQYGAPANGGKIYYLQKGENEWIERPAPQSTLDGSRGNILLPSGYEGWIRIPYGSTNMDKAKSREIFRFEFVPKYIGGDYTAEPVSIGSFMILEEGSKEYTNITLDGTTETSLLVELESYNTKLLFPQNVDGASEVENETVISKGYTYSLLENSANIIFTEEATIVENGSILAYVRLPIYESMGVTVTLNGVAPNKSVECAFLDRGKKDWETISTDDNGALMLSDSFEGYIMIPLSAYSVPKNDSVKNIGFAFEKNGGYIGSVMISDSTEKLNVIRLDIDPRPCYLVKKAYYRAELIETESEVKHNPTDNTYYNISQKKADAEFSVGIDNGYYYEISPGSADIGEYNINSAGETPSYTANTATNFSAPSGILHRPTKQTAFKVSLSDEITDKFATKELNFKAGTECTYDNDTVKDSNYLDTATGIYSNVSSFADGGYYYAEINFAPIKWTTTGAVMFYVKSTGTADSQMCVMNANKWVYLLNNADYYRLNNGATEWESCKAVKNSGNVGNFVIPAGFEGWIRIPTSSMAKSNGNNADEHDMTRLEFFPALLGGQYGEITVSHFMTVNEGNQDCFVLKANGDSNEIKLINSDVQKKFKINMSLVSGEKVFTTNAVAGDMYSSIKLKESKNISPDEALMFYIRQEGRTKSNVRVELGNIGMKLDIGSTYYLYDSKTESWSEYSAQDSGKIELYGGFSGWIRIPYNSFTDADNKVDPDGFEINELLITPYQLGGPYGTTKIGNFMIVNHGNEQLPTMRVNKGIETALTAMNIYTAKVLTPDEIYPMGTNARKLEVVSESWPLLEGGYNYKVISKSLGVTMDGSSALEITLSDSVKIKQEDCLILYVKLPKENELILDGVLKTAAQREVYTLSKNETVWSEIKTNSNGYIALKSGFDGYIRVPFASLENEISEGIDKFILGFKNVGEEYGEPIFGSVMISNNAKLNCTDIYVDEMDYSQTLLQESQLKGYLMQGTMANCDDSQNIISITPVLDNPLTSNIPESYTYSINANREVKLDGKTFEPRARFTVDELYQSTMASSGGIMFYVSIPEGIENTMHFQAKADVYVTMASAARYSVLQNGNAYWEEKVATNDGDITFSEGFNGWIKIPYKSLTSTSGAYIGAATQFINFTFRKLGGEYGKPMVSNIIMLTNYGDFGSIKLSGYDAPITLYGSKQKTTYDRDDIAVWESVLNPFEGYEPQDVFPVRAEIDTNTESEATSTYSSKVLTGVTPFAAKGLEVTSSNHVKFTPNHHPLFTFRSPFTVRDGKGIVIYVKIPDNGIETNEFYLQIKTAAGKWLSFKKPIMGAYLQKGMTDWRYALRDDQEILLPSGFEGYVYYPFEALTTYDNSIITVSRLSLI